MTEAERAVAESVRNTEQLARVVTELELQLAARATEMTRLKGDCDHAAVLATYVREECEALRGKLMTAEAEVKRLTFEIETWKS